MKFAYLFVILGLGLGVPTLSWGQEGDSDVESLYDDFDQADLARTKAKRKRKPKVKINKEFLKLGDLVSLSPFEDVAVIQRKYLPKTKRFEGAFSGVLGLNNAFFTNLGLSARMSYYFTEKWGVDVNYFQFTSTSRDITDNLRDNQKINTKTLIEAENYIGAAIKWVPVFGKMAFMDKKIVPFDIYFAPGFGITKTKAGESASTISLGTGQVFAISKSMAFRWDFVWNIFQAEVEESTVGAGKQTKMQNDLYISAGMSFFFPEATYR